MAMINKREFHDRVNLRASQTEIDYHEVDWTSYDLGSGFCFVFANKVVYYISNLTLSPCNKNLLLLTKIT